MRTRATEIKTYETKDGSLIKELMHPDSHANKNQSLAEAIVPPGCITALHKHQKTEELYYITSGKGRMTLGDQQFEVEPGDSICINPGTAHCIENIDQEDLRFLCCCSPAYSHDDTELL
jgi:mannose-6-phosphate isomerase-like protein (cupin superfamily)